MEYSPIALALLNQATDTRLPRDKPGMGATLSDMMLQQAQQPQQSPTVFVDPQGSIAQTLAPLMQEFIGTLADSVNNTGNAVAVLAEGQQAMLNQMANDNAVTQAMLSEVARPKQAQIQIVKQADGTFTGSRIEV